MRELANAMRPRPVADRVRFAGLMMTMSLFWALMPVAIALGADYSGGIGVYVLGSKTPIGVYPDMLVWLSPLCVLTTVAGVLLFFGRGYRLGLLVSLLWVAIGALASPELLVAMGFLAWCVFSGRHSFTRTAR